MIRFVVLAAPRTGSNWLCTLLNSHPDVLCHHEIFNPDGIHTAISVRDLDLGFGSVTERDCEPMRVLDRVWRESLGNAAVGFKLNRGQDGSVFRHVLSDQAVRKIVIRRANRIRTFVSERLAEVTGAWESYDGAEGVSPPRAVRVDPAELCRHVAVNRAYYDTIAQALAALHQPVCRVRYEDLNNPAARRRLLTFIDVSPDVALRSGTWKRNDAPLETLIENYAELSRALRGSDLEHDLLDEAEGAKPWEPMDERGQPV